VEPSKLANKTVYLSIDADSLVNWLYVQHTPFLRRYEEKHGTFAEELLDAAHSLQIDAQYHHHKYIKEQAKRQRQSRKINTSKLNLIRNRMIFLADYATMTAVLVPGRRMARVRNNHCKRMRFFAGYCENAAAKILSKKQ
jgi:hypothetical protein